MGLLGWQNTGRSHILSHLLHERMEVGKDCNSIEAMASHLSVERRPSTAAGIQQKAGDGATETHIPMTYRRAPDCRKLSRIMAAPDALRERLRALESESVRSHPVSLIPTVASSLEYSGLFEDRVLYVGRQRQPLD